MRRSKAIEKEIEELRDEAERIGSDNNFLREQIEYLKSDHYKERLAKDKLNLKNPGEQVVVVQPGGKSADTSEDRRESENFEEESYKEEISNFKKWLRYFFN
ncbi:MAG: septum formation initiator family protein [Candidatus Moranbacteria bacterium]|nr:septum formation initiator family protein [Candidatus Moranbacteria bacterium]MDD5651892.1 septum formation initiator family protein [Candidatus Moranbacteria bacterium]MDX9855353.1 septum formation initiator family protein [Candidatus Moranbacteria bacterium]